MAEKEDRDLDTPPYFKSWSSIYLIVTASLAGVIGLIYWFSTAFV